MKLTESKLRYMIRDLLWEASVGSSVDRDGDADDAAELRDIAADMDRARKGRMGRSARHDAKLYDLDQERAASQGRIPFLDWSQLVADASKKLSGIQDLGSAPDGSKDGYHPETGERITPYDAWTDNVDPKVYAQSIDALAPGDEGSDDYDEELWDVNEMGILPNGRLGKLLRENMYDENPTLPTEFIDDKAEAYINRKPFRQKMSDLEYGPDSAPEDILAIALSNRAEELEGFRTTIAPEIFKDLAMRIYQNYIVSKAGDPGDSLSDITTKIDAGGYFDEDIGDVPGWKNLLRAPGTLSESRLIHLAGLKED